MIPTQQSVIQVDIANAGAQIFSGACRQVVAPAAFGEICIMPRHAPLLTKLYPGEVRMVTDKGVPDALYISGGFMEVQPFVVTILADSSLRAEEIDREAAEEAMRQAEEVLQRSHLFRERDAARIEFAKALAQLRLLERVRSDKY